MGVGRCREAAPGKESSGGLPVIPAEAVTVTVGPQAPPVT